MLKYGTLCGAIALLLIPPTACTDPPVPHCGRPTPLLTLRAGPGRLWVLRYSPNGKQLVTCGPSAYGALWDAVTGKRLLTLEGESALFVRTVAYHPKGDHLVMGDWGGTLALWHSGT